MSIKSKENLFRVPVNLNESLDETIKEVAGHKSIHGVWNLVELINPLYRMASNDIIKYEIFKKYDMNDYLQLIIYHGNLIEIQYALKMLWQLCYNKLVASEVAQNKNLIAKIKQIRKEAECNDNKQQAIDTITKENLLKNSIGIIWLLKQKHYLSSKKRALGNKKLLNSTPVKEKHIMISYNRESRDICLKIKSELEKMNYKVWIDVDNMHGSSLKAMGNAIDNSLCVLVCMTEKYMLSRNCRAEAEYMFESAKSYVPLILQKNYIPNGWLG